MSRKKRIIIGITGASGIVYAVRVLEALNQGDFEVHLVMSTWAKSTLQLETDYSLDYVTSLVDVVHHPKDMAASIASGSYLIDAMVIVPCSMKTLAGVAMGYADNLIARAADVCLKEKRRLIIVARETPLNEIHLENMLKLARMGAMIVPPMVAFYHKPENLDDAINHTVSKLLDALSIENELSPRWKSE